jgi:hypothetical protein
MAHRLVPEAGEPHLDPSEILFRLRGEFAVVDEDWEEGARHVDQMLAQFERMDAPEEIIEAHRRARDETVAVVVADDPEP